MILTTLFSLATAFTVTTHPVDVDSMPCRFGMTRALHAAQKGDIVTLKKCFEKMDETQFLHQDAMTSKNVLHHAMHAPTPICAKYIIETCQDSPFFQQLFLAKDCYERTPWMLMADIGRADMAKATFSSQLIQRYRKELDSSFSYMWLTLTDQNFAAIADELILQGVLPQGVEEETRLTPLMYACQISDVQILKAYLKNVTDSTPYLAIDAQGNTTLHHAAEYHVYQGIGALIQRGAIPNARNHATETPLHRASRFSAYKVARELLKNGAINDTLDSHNNTPLLIAAHARSLETCEILVEYGANINAQNDEGLTPAMRAANNFAPHVVEFLLEKGCDLSLKNKQGESLYEFAKRLELTDIMTLIQAYQSENK